MARQTSQSSRTPTLHGRMAGRPSDDLSGLALLFRATGLPDRSSAREAVEAAMVRLFRSGNHKFVESAREVLLDDNRSRVAALLEQLLDMAGPLLEQLAREVLIGEEIRGRNLGRRVIARLKRVVGEDGQ